MGADLMKHLIARLIAGLTFIAVASTASAAPAIERPETFRLWKVPGGVFDTGLFWFDEASLLRKSSLAEYWVLKVEPHGDVSTPKGGYSGLWQKISTDCAGGSDKVLVTIAVNAMNYEVLREEKAGQLLLAPKESTDGANIRKRACATSVEADSAPRATAFARAVIWTRMPENWAKQNAPKTGSQ